MCLRALTLSSVYKNVQRREGFSIMSHNILLTLGRLPKGLELARCLSGAGCTVYVADPLGTHLSKPSRAVKKSIKVAAPRNECDRFLSDLLGIIDQYAIDLVIPVSEEAPFVAELHGRVPDHVDVLCAQPPQLLRLHDKYAFAMAVRAAGLTAPDTFRANDPDALALMARADTVLKPVSGCSGSGLRFLKQGASLARAERNPGTIVQRRINGREVSTLSFVRSGNVLGTVVYEGLVFAGTVATAFRRVTDAPAIERWIESYVENRKLYRFRCL